MQSLIPLIETFGYIGIFAILFAESGLLIGFIFPGDTLLFAAGLLAADGFFNIGILLAGSFIFAVLGDSFGYWVGQKTGPRLFKKEESFFFRKEYIEKAQLFFEKHGRKTIILSRYIPIVRTFAPMLAGVGHMRYKTFLKYNLIGGALWCGSMLLAGYFLGRKIPNIDTYVLPIVVGIFILSFIPVVFQLVNRKKKRQVE
jgi:membrane-associated protein